MNVRSFHCGPFANDSERKAFEHVRSRLESTRGDGDWVLLTNLAFSVTPRMQADEIDLVAIGPPGVRVVEVKHWTPEWVDAHPEVVGHEADKVTHKARRIGTTLRRSVPKLDRVDGAILLTRESSRMKSLSGRKVRGVGIHTLKDWRDAVGFDAAEPAALRPPRVAMLSRLLEPKSAVALDGSLRRFAGYENLELRTPKTERFHRVYAGVHSDSQDHVILHLYDLSASDAANAEKRAQREFEALRRLQLHDWAPRTRDSFQDAPGYAGEMHFFTLVDPAAPSIEKRKSDVSWESPARLAFARNAVHALRELHGTAAEDGPVAHRNLTARTILVRHDGRPILTGFEWSQIPSDVTVASAGAPAGGWDQAAAPEVREGGRHAAGKRSDVYSLCAALTDLFQGRDDEESRQAVDVLKGGLAENPDARRGLEDLENALAELLGETPPAPPPPPARFWTEEQVVPFHGREYRVVERLGSGGVGTTFRVVQLDRTTREDIGTYVAKVAHDEETGRRLVGAYSLARSHLRHQAVSGIFEVAEEWRENEFTALLTWIKGSPLSDCVFPLLARDQHEESGEALAVRWLRTMCEALDVLHRNGLVHGDVSPRNMIVSGGDLVLTDYDFVRKIGEAGGAPGTVLYSAPTSGSGPATLADDLYALAASFFHVLFEREPFRHGGDLAKQRGLNWEGIDRAEYPAVADFLDRAAHPDAARRFGSAKEALEALRPPRPAPAIDTQPAVSVPAPDAGPGDVSSVEGEPRAASQDGPKIEDVGNVGKASHRKSNTAIGYPKTSTTDNERPAAVWVVRANGGSYTEHFVANGYAGIGTVDVSSAKDRDEIRRLCEQAHPDWNAGRIGNYTGQYYDFLFRIREGDYVLTPELDAGRLRYGRVIGPGESAAGDDGCPYRNRRAVDWHPASFSRVRLSKSLRKTLQRPPTIFPVSQREEFLDAVGLSDAAPRGDWFHARQRRVLLKPAIASGGRSPTLDAGRPEEGRRPDVDLPYDMGNAGDLLKHGVLAEFVRWQCESKVAFRFLDPFGGEPWSAPRAEVARRVRSLPEECALRSAQSEIDHGRYYGSGLVVRRVADACGRADVRVLVSDRDPAKRKRLRECGLGGLQMLTDDFPGRSASGCDGYAAFSEIVRGAKDGDLVLLDPYDRFLPDEAPAVVPRMAEMAGRAAVLLFALNLNPNNWVGRRFDDLLEKHLPSAWRMTCPPLRGAGVKGESTYHAEVILAARAFRDDARERGVDALWKRLREFSRHLAAALDLPEDALAPRKVRRREPTP